MRESIFSAKAWKLIAFVWFVVGLSGAAYRALVDHAQTDGTTLAFLVFAFAAFVIPIVSSIALPGGTKIEFLKQAQSDAAAIEDNYALATTDLAQLLRDVIATQTRVTGLFRHSTVDQATAYSIALEVTVSMMLNCKRWFVSEAIGHTVEKNHQPESVRVTLWRWDERQKALTFLAGTVSDAQGEVLQLQTLTVDEADYMGDTWHTLRISNQSMAPDDWRAPFRTNPGDLAPYPDPVLYQGLMFVPVVVEGRARALIEIDRQKALRFDITAQIVASALAEFISAVFGDPVVNWGLLQKAP